MRHRVAGTRDAVAALRKTPHGFFDDLMDKFVVSDNDEQQAEAPPPSRRKDDRDVAEKLFGFFFGEVEDAPMGLTRMNVDTQPDQYTAETSGNR